MVKGGADFFFLSLPFFFLSFFLIFSSQKFEGGLKGGSMGFWGLGGATQCCLRPWHYVRMFLYYMSVTLHLLPRMNRVSESTNLLL